MKTVFRHVVLPWMVAAIIPAPAFAGDKSEALYEITLDIDKDGKSDRAVLVLVGPGRTDFNPLTQERYGLSEEENVDLHIYLGTGDDKLDLSRAPTFMKKAIIDRDETNWVQPLEKNDDGSLVLTSVYGWGARKSWGESLTIVHRGGDFLVGGYAKDWEWANEVRKADGTLDVETAIGGCDIDFLTGKAVASQGLDEEETPIEGKFTPVKFADWPAGKLPEACEVQ
ncbi:hypothetical protein [Mesorhizobium sp. ZC-5]|uniref:hypothetical protein n=1 Tax=Mesorhizobium sp. ZC-5 TaxID=2986066 RepID=UPI0021E6E83F|nr:hypothetical protein [Mesorhizobium sp. ZC-5]MCV3239734.1 hypothetical protein [Mesorhizobium sp. ZC-5]